MATLTFEEMRKDCAEQGHVLWWMDFENDERRVWHDDDSIIVSQERFSADLARIDAWRLNLHKSAIQAAYESAVAGEF